MSYSNFTQVPNIVAEAGGISKNLVYSHCFRRGGAQYRFMFALGERHWSLKQVKWWVVWEPSEKAEIVTRYLLDCVLHRGENQLGDALTRDAILCTNAALKEFKTSTTDALDLMIRTETISLSLLTICEGLRDIVKFMGLSQSAVPTQGGNCEVSAVTEVQDTSNLVSDLPDAKSWRDYFGQYWKSNPACHQYRAGLNA
ncbi:hypothetical protein PHMEG_00035079 [Phytophthora megakarya]|uniref:Uncharacterized protein n=1 Tax=Phytophthora megakarya TaxID=4795 RepID=A0A225UPJ5_9STRA|nr:hypothetical protein PHMEG_00035079 [Phytophthora megakarya]